MPKSLIQITQSKAGFRVKYYAANGEMLAVSEVLESMANARKNIKAMTALINLHQKQKA